MKSFAIRKGFDHGPRSYRPGDVGQFSDADARRLIARGLIEEPKLLDPSVAPSEKSQSSSPRGRLSLPKASRS